MTMLLWVFEHYRGPHSSNHQTEELLDHLLLKFPGERYFLNWFWNISEI